MSLQEGSVPVNKVAGRLGARLRLPQTGVLETLP
jgi:hypothetical protein